MSCLRRSLSPLLPIILLTLALNAQARSQQWWLPVDTVTTGPDEDHNPSMPRSRSSYTANAWLVFDRLTPSESQIASVRFLRTAAIFDSVVVVVASRSRPDLQTKPDVGALSVRTSGLPRSLWIASWQCFKHGRWQILYSEFNDSSNAWSDPRLLVADSLDNTDVRMTATGIDSLMLFTWRRGSAVMGLLRGFATSTAPETLAVTTADSLEYDIVNGGNGIEIVWKSRVSGQDAIFHRTISGASPFSVSDADTVVIAPQLAAPGVMHYWSLGIGYESTVNGKTDVFGVHRQYYSGGPWTSPVNISDDSLSDDRNVRSYMDPAVYKVNAGQSTPSWYSDVTVYEKCRGTDSMLVFLSGSQPYGQHDTVRSRGYNRNATISAESAWRLGSYVRIPVVWESNRTGTAHIYARLVALISGAVPEPPSRPGQFELYQNYPNPFNPATRITWFMPAAGRVRLAVYDILGREVRLLVDGPRDSGTSVADFDGSGLASGVYFYRLRVMPAAGGEVTRARAMILVR